MWSRNRYTGPGGGLYTGPGGGLYTGPDSNIYSSNWPPPKVLLNILRENRMTQIVNLLVQNGF